MHSGCIRRMHSLDAVIQAVDAFNGYVRTVRGYTQGMHSMETNGSCTQVRTYVHGVVQLIEPIHDWIR